MPATKLQTHRLEKPWGRHQLFPGFLNVPDSDAPIGEVWFQEPGDNHPDLLIKYLFTSEKLSVQVHPDDEQAYARGLPRGKDECWLILAAESDSTIALGPKQSITRDQLRTYAQDGSIEQKLDWVPVKAGDFFYAPSGTIHALGGGLTLIEVQQNSETTYRLFDYGSDRELHLKDGVDVAHLAPYQAICAPDSVNVARSVLVEGPKFVLERWSGGEHQLSLPEGVTAWIVSLKGGGEVGGVEFKAGECVTVNGTETIKASDDADLLLAYPGVSRICEHDQPRS